MINIQYYSMNKLDDILSNAFELDLEGLSSFIFPKDKVIGLNIIENNVKYEFLVKISSKSDRLICFGGSGLVNQKKTKLPVFERHSWITKFKESIIIYADPTFKISPEIRAGWFLGNEDDWYLETISNIINKIMENSKISAENSLFYGTSSSAFSSIALATLLKSTAVAGNFHYNVFKAPGPIAIKRAKKILFNNLDEKIIMDKYGYRIDLLELFKKEDYVPKIISYINTTHKIDLVDNCLPFIKGLHDLKGNFKEVNDVEIILYSSEDGHHGRIKRNTIIPFIKLISARKMYGYFDVPKDIFHYSKRENDNLEATIKRKILKKGKSLEKPSVLTMIIYIILLIIIIYLLL